MRTTYIGMDIHKNFIQAAAMDKDGTILTEQKFKSDINGIRRFVDGLDSGKIKAAIEATCTWYHVYETLNSLGIDTTLVNIRYCQNSSITRLYNRVMKKKGKAKATVAAGRKMLTIIWHMLMKGERFKYSV